MLLYSWCLCVPLLLWLRASPHSPKKTSCCSRFLFWISLYRWFSLKTWMESSTPCAQSETWCPNSFNDPLKNSLPVCKVSLEGPVRKGPWSMLSLEGPVRKGPWFVLSLEGPVRKDPWFVLSLQILNTGIWKDCGPESSGANYRLSEMGQATINEITIDLVSFSCLWIT